MHSCRPSPLFCAYTFFAVALQNPKAYDMPALFMDIIFLASSVFMYFVVTSAVNWLYVDLVVPQHASGTQAYQ